MPFDKYLIAQQANIERQKAIDTDDREAFSDVVIATSRKLALSSYEHAPGMSAFGEKKSGAKKPQGPPPNVRLHKGKVAGNKYEPTEDGSDLPDSTKRPPSVRYHKPSNSKTEYEPDEAVDGGEDEGDASWDEALDGGGEGDEESEGELGSEVKASTGWCLCLNPVFLYPFGVWFV